MKKLFTMTAAVVASVFIASSAMALDFGETWDDPDETLQHIFNDFTIGGDSSIDVENDYIDDSIDSYWKQTATGTSAMTMIIEVAGNDQKNTFGIYDQNNPDTRIELFSGPDSPGMLSGGRTAFSILADGSVFIDFQDTGIDFGSASFGYYLDSTEAPYGPQGVFYSDTSLNSDEKDHMAAYQGNNSDVVRLTDDQPAEGLTWSDNEYILAWEDLAYNSPGTTDMDYNDFVVMVESVEPVPEPGTVLLLGAGLLGLLALKRKRS